jgi:hypothetical protein
MGDASDEHLTVDLEAPRGHPGANDLLLKAERLTTPFTTQNRPKAVCDSIGLCSPIRKIASTSKDI